MQGIDGGNNQLTLCENDYLPDSPVMNGEFGVKFNYLNQLVPAEVHNSLICPKNNKYKEYEKPPIIKIEKYIHEHQ